MKDYPPSNGEEAVKPTRIVIVNNSKKSNKAPIIEIDYEEIGSIKVILNQSSFESSVSNVDKSDESDEECNSLLNSNEIISEEDNALYLRINAMHEGTWNFTEISRQALEEAASTYKGRLVIEGHKWDDPERSIGEVLKASVKFDPELQRYYLEVIAKITKERAIKEVKAGRYKFVSVGASMQARCNICGMTVSEGCNHVRGAEYDTQDHGRLLCIKIASDIIFEELSFINVPAARWARVLEELNPEQARELLAASKSRGTFSIEVESENTRILPTLDEFLSLQEESIIKLYNRKEEVSNMSQDKSNEVKKVGEEETFSAPGSAAPVSAPAAATPQNTVVKPTEVTPVPVQEQSSGNVSEVAAPSNPTDGGTVNTGDNEASKEEIPMPVDSESSPDANASEVPATQHPLDGGTVDTGDGVNKTGDPENMNPVVRSDELTVEEANVEVIEEGTVQNDTLTLTNEQIDEMDIASIYEYAKNNGMNSLVDILVLANEEKEPENCTIDIKSASEAILAHAILHMWKDDLTLTNWKEESINDEHDRIVKVLEGFDIGHEDESEETFSAPGSAAPASAPAAATPENTVVTPTEVTPVPVQEQSPGNVSDVEAPIGNPVDGGTVNTVKEEEYSKAIELLNSQIESLNVELTDVKSKFDLVTVEFNTEKEKNSNEIYVLKFNLAKSNRLNQKLESDIMSANTLIAEKTSEIEILNSKIDSYSKKEFNEVVEQLVAIKTDMNKYSDEESVTKDREKFSKMSIDSLKAVLDELLVVKENLVKNTVAEEFGLGESNNNDQTVTEEAIENIVDGNGEIDKYQKEGELENEVKDVTNNKTTTQEEVVENTAKTFTVREGSVLSLVKKSLELK
jgi:hypothetical protein